MNLCVNLIEESEKRQAGALSVLMVVRIIAIAIPILLLLFVAHLAVSLTLNRSQLQHTEAIIEDKKDQLALSAEILKQQKVYRDMLNQLNGWKSLRLDWNQQLESLRLTVPLEIQITRLSLTQALSASNSIPRADYKLLLAGKTGGQNPESNLTRFRLNLVKDPKLAEVMNDVIVPEGSFVEDSSPGAHPTDRLFELNCTFNPRIYK